MMDSTHKLLLAVDIGQTVVLVYIAMLLTWEQIKPWFDRRAE